MFISPVVLLSACLAASPPSQTAPNRLKMNVPVDASVTAAGAVAWVLSETVLKHTLAPAACRWCDRAADGTDTLNAVDRAGRSLRWSLQGQKTADTLSNVSGFGLVPLSAIGLDLYLAHDAGETRLAGEDLLIVGESAVLALVLNQGVKFIAGRERPFVHALPPEEKPLTAQPDDNNLSFFSGHSTFVFSVVVATGVVAEERGYKNAWLVWAVGLPLAAGTAYLRMGADKHYLTDVLTGTVIGTAFGIGVPLLLHPRVPAWICDVAPPAGVTARLVPTGNGAALVGTF